MKKISIYFLATVVVGLSVTSTLAQKQTPPPGGQPKDFVLPPKKNGQLPNGLHSTLVQYGDIPKVTINIIVKTGNVHEGANEVWLADLTGNLMREGTQSMDFKAISRKVAAMGGNINIGVGPDQTFVSGSVLSEFAPDLVKILSDLLINPAFPEKEIERLKGDLKRQLSVQRSQPSSLALEKFNSVMYKEHPYGTVFPSQEMIAAYNVDMVKTFYEKNFGARRTVVYVAGKFDEAAVEKSIAESFTTWKEGPAVSYPPVKVSKSGELATIDRPGAPQTTIMLGLPTLMPKDPDYVALQVTNTMLGGSFASRITSNIREDKGYTYSPHSAIQNKQGVSVWVEDADVTTEHTGASLQEIAKEIRRLQDEAPSKQEVEGFQNYMAGIFVLQNSSQGGIIGQLNFIDSHGLDETYLTNRVKNIYAVTPEQISKMTRDNFKYEDMTLVMVGDKKALEKQKKQFEDSRKLK